MTTSRSNYFYEQKPSLTGSYKDTAFDFKFSSRHIKIAVEGGDLEFSLVGADDTKSDGLVRPTDGIVHFDGLEANRLALKQVAGTVTRVRVWAYK